MIHGFHLIFTAYGFWLPNDPRGSWSDFVASWELFLKAGHATRVYTTRSVANRPHDRAARLEAKEALKYKPVSWTGKQAVVMARGFQEVMHHWKFNIFACSILPKHAHMVIGRTDRNIRLVMNQLKGRASAALVAEHLHPFQNVFDNRGTRATCWTSKGWSVFLDSEEDMRRAIGYVERNPIKDRKKKQNWSWVKRYQA